MKLALGDRVQTPDGDGTIVGETVWEDRHYWPPLRFPRIMVELDRGAVRAYPSGKLEPFSTRGENEAEGLAVERHQEAKHGEP